jgi:hypothetical protein
MLSLQTQPPVVFSDFSGSPDTLRAMIRAAHGPRGEQSVLVRAATEAATSGLVPKDYLGEIVAVRNWVAENVRYMNDPLHVEWVKDPQRLIEERMRGEAVGDCFPEGTLVVAEGHGSLSIQQLVPGLRIWGLDRWSTVQAVQYKGVLPIDITTLSNGCALKLTSDHRVYVKNGIEKRIRVSDLRVGMTLAQPEHETAKQISVKARARRGLLGVDKIERALMSVPCWDIQTDDHRVYLPECDVTVSQCDDIATLIATMSLQLGRICEFVVAGFGEPGHFSHVFVRVLEPKSGQWIVCDPVAGTNERQMLQRVTTYETWSLDEPLAA